jgi:sortase A
MRNVLRRAGWVMISLGAFTLYFLVYQLIGTNAITSKAQDELRRELTEQWSATGKQPGARTIKAEPAPRAGRAFAYMRIPKIDLEAAVVQGHERPGMSQEDIDRFQRLDLKKGPTHIGTTKLPGSPGTFAVAGHRTTYGAPFNALDKLKRGDEIRVSTALATYTYKITSTRIVVPTQVEVLRDVKGKDGKLKAQIVLSTCHPKYSARQRLIVFGELSSTTPNNGTVSA